LNQIIQTASWGHIDNKTKHTFTSIKSLVVGGDEYPYWKGKCMIDVEYSTGGITLGGDGRFCVRLAATSSLMVDPANFAALLVLEVVAGLLLP